MLPSSAAGFRARFGDDSYPFAELIAGGTLILLYAIEKIALGGQHSHSDVNCEYIIFRALLKYVNKYLLTDLF